MATKRTLVCEIECPHCEKGVRIFKETETITPAVKAEKKEDFVAEKTTQTKLP